MDIDPIDDGPREVALSNKASHPPMTMTTTTTTSMLPPAENLSEEEEARQAIDMLRGDDVSARVAAANRLESVASVLGEVRTREVRNFFFFFFFFFV